MANLLHGFEFHLEIITIIEKDSLPHDANILIHDLSFYSTTAFFSQWEEDALCFSSIAILHMNLITFPGWQDPLFLSRNYGDLRFVCLFVDFVVVVVDHLSICLPSAQFDLGTKFPPEASCLLPSWLIRHSQVAKYATVSHPNCIHAYYSTSLFGRCCLFVSLCFSTFGLSPIAFSLEESRSDTSMWPLFCLGSHNLRIYVWEKSQKPLQLILCLCKF